MPDKSTVDVDASISFNNSTFNVITWNIEGITRNIHSLKYFSSINNADFIFLSEPQIYQNDIDQVLLYLQGEYNYSLNSRDKLDPELPLVKPKAIGGCMILWKLCFDPYITVHPVPSSSILPIVFNPPGTRVSVHISIYLPTHGQDEEFIEELANLAVCLDELLDIHPDALVFLRGDFNVNDKNTKRTALLKRFFEDAELHEIEIDHPTYHHFTGNGKSDSSLDKLVISKTVEIPEKIKKIHCKIYDPTIDSHHDLIVSECNLPTTETKEPTSMNISAPKLENNRTKIFWTDEGVEQYQHLVAPELLHIRQLWLSGAEDSKTSLSLLLEATNNILTITANNTNKSVMLDKKFPPKSKKTPLNIRKSARKLRIMHRNLKISEQAASPDFPRLRDIYISERAAHRRLDRRNKAAEAATRDSFSSTILSKNPRPLFKHIKSAKKGKSSNINKLRVNQKTYLDDKVPDGFYDSISSLKTRDDVLLQNSPHFQALTSDYHHILEVSRHGHKIPQISETDSFDLLMNLKADVNDLFSLTPNHYIYAGPPGWIHFHLLLSILINNINNTVIDEVNTVYACILFKGHGKNRFSDRSYRTISTCPVTAKALDTYIRKKNIHQWNKSQSPCQFQGEGSSHELASLLLTECIQHSIHHLKEPVFTLYLDAKSAFDLVQRELLVRNLYFSGTSGETLLYINNRLENRKTVLDWNGKLMGPVNDQQGLEQGGVSSSDFYKIFAQEQLDLLQDSSLGVPLGPITVSGIGQADDSVIVTNNIHHLKYLLELTITFCNKHLVQLCSDKTVLQVYHNGRSQNKVDYLKTMFPLKIDSKVIEYEESTEHVGVIRSVTGNLPSLLSRIAAHKRALGGILHAGLARSHRGNPIASIRLHNIYANPVLYNGLGSLLLIDKEVKVLVQHIKNTISNLQRLLPRTPSPVIFFLAGTLPGDAVLHLRQLSLFGMITRLPHSILHGHAKNIFSMVTQSSKSWFHKIRDLCLQYRLPHPSVLLESPLPKEKYKLLVKKHVVDLWEQKLRHEAGNLSSLQYFKPTFMSLTSPHPIWTTAAASPTKVVMATQQARLLSGRYRTAALTSHWSDTSGACKLSPSCNTTEDTSHFLKHCSALQTTRENLFSFTDSYSDSHPLIASIIQKYCKRGTECRLFCQFILDCSVLPEVIIAVQTNGQVILHHLFNITRIWCYALHRERLKILNKWRNFTNT